MHRHQYKGRKFGRKRDQRRALIKSLADSLVLSGSIETTLAKAKEIVPYTEKLITKAKNPTLANRRLIVSRLHTLEASHKLVDEIAPKLRSRTSGHLRVTKTTSRRGDNALLAKVSFVDDLKAEAGKKHASSKPPVKKQPAKPSSKTKKKEAK